MGRHNEDQYILPFDGRKNELLAQVNLLRNVPTQLTPVRQDKVIELLERLLLKARQDLVEINGCVNVRVHMTDLGSGIDRRSTVSSRQVQNWRQWAVELGVLNVDVRSHRYGRREWNLFVLNVAKIRALVLAGSGRKWPEVLAVRPEGSSSPRPEGSSSPRPEGSSSPCISIINRALSHSQPADTQPSVDTRRCVHTGREVTQGACVSVFLKLGVSKATTLVAEALERGCDTRSLLALARWYERSQRSNPTRWEKPSTVLMLRLRDAQPGVAAWLGWVPGRVPRHSPHAPRIVPVVDYRQERMAAVAEWEDMTVAYLKARAGI